VNANAAARAQSAGRSLRVAFVTQPWDQIMPSRGGCDGSIAIITHEMARRLVGLGHHVCVYGAGRRFDFSERREEALGVEFRTLPAVRLELKVFGIYQKAADRLLGQPPANRPRFASRAYLAAYGRQLARTLRERHYDIVHVHNLFQVIPAIRAANPGVRIILHMHCEWLSQIAADIIADYLEGVDLVIGVSDHIADKVRARFPQKAARCRTLYNSVDLEAFGGMGVGRLPREEGRRRLLFVGRVSPEKGVHLLIDAFAKIDAEFPDAELDIVGPPAQVAYDFLVALDDGAEVASLASFYGPGKGSYLEQVKARVPAALKSRINFLGGVPYGQVSGHYRAADVFLNASYSEAFSMPTAEAMANGLPVVAARVGGVKEIVRHNETGLLFDVGDAGMLAEGIARLLRDGALRRSMGEAGRARITRSFSWETTVRRLESTYREMLQ